MGIAIQTDGDADDEADVRVVSTRAAGAGDIKLSVLGGAANTNDNIAPGAAVIVESVHASNSLLQFMATDNSGVGGLGTALWVTCKANNHGTTQDSASTATASARSRRAGDRRGRTAFGSGGLLVSRCGHSSARPLDI